MPPISPVAKISLPVQEVARIVTAVQDGNVPSAGDAKLLMEYTAGQLGLPGAKEFLNQCPRAMAGMLLGQIAAYEAQVSMDTILTFFKNNLKDFVLITYGEGGIPLPPLKERGPQALVPATEALLAIIDVKDLSGENEKQFRRAIEQGEYDAQLKLKLDEYLEWREQYLRNPDLPKEHD